MTRPQDAAPRDETSADMHKCRHGAAPSPRKGAPEWAWFARGRMSQAGPWHIVKSLGLADWNAATFCGAAAHVVRRSVPTAGKLCPKCRALAGAS